ncbi:MAG: outer membrane beta-barrel protein [Vicinamibacterales bacterium]
MFKSLEMLTRAVALGVTVGGGIATAQTVVVRDAVPGAPVEVQVDGGTPQTATADKLGDATIKLTSPAGAQETEVRLVIEKCPDRVRVLIVGPGITAEAAANCNRTEIPWLFVMRPVTSFVVDLAGTAPAVHLRQGPVPGEWLLRGAAAQAAQSGPAVQPPSGFLLAGHAALSNFSKMLDVACGNVSSCTGSTTKGTFGATAAYWLTPVLGVRAGFVKPGTFSVEGEGSNYSFDSSLETRLFTVEGMVGATTGRARIYGFGGLHRHTATFIQNQTIESSTITIDNVPTTLEGGSVTSTLETNGWGWQAGGGLEWWFTRRVSVFGEGQYLRLRGADANGTDARIEENLTTIGTGIRIHIGR